MNSITNIEDFLKIKDSIVKENIAFDNEEYEYGLTCIAAGIKDMDGKVIAVINVSGPTSRLKFKGIDKIKEKLIQSAGIISESTIYL